MGKYIFGIITVLAVLIGVFIFGYSAGVTANGGRVCEMDPETGSASKTGVCIVDGVRYVPEDSQTDE